eukprot:2566256-Rhodomonas_salina.1
MARLKDRHIHRSGKNCGGRKCSRDSLDNVTRTLRTCCSSTLPSATGLAPLGFTSWTYPTRLSRRGLGSQPVVSEALVRRKRGKAPACATASCGGVGAADALLMQRGSWDRGGSEHWRARPEHSAQGERRRVAYGQGGEGLRLLLCSSRDLMEEQKDEADMHVCDACFNAAIAP